ncbi:hypothetical protein R3P38DRAFT_2524387 [Favolaschia claudopus]|uniref:Novel STAND NTPase 1 domain-containing protein n=1 Tax=Favolaschia claudopus TaxID=2862362 RepID=A0AAW0BSH9_9AGAR
MAIDFQRHIARQYGDRLSPGISPSGDVAVSGGRALADALDGVSDLIPLPFLSAFVNIAIKVLEACEEATAIEEDLMDLQERVYDLMLLVVNTVPVNRRVSIALQDKVRRLQSILDNILLDVGKIKAQKKWLLLFFHNLNKDRVDRCVGRLTGALEQFTVRSLFLAVLSVLIFSQVVSHLHVEDVLDKIRAEHSAFAAQLNRIEDAVNRTTQPHTAPSAYPRQDMPPTARRLFGRESLIDEIASLLTNESTSRVCITGAGGMGKTSVALAVAESPIIKRNFNKDRIFWIPCVEARSSDLLRRILYAQLRVTAETHDTLDALLDELDAIKDRRLLLLDNFETPWLSGQDRDKVGHILSRLAALPHIALLVTMTSSFTPGDIEWQHRPLAPLEPAAARDAFKAKYRDAADGHALAEGEGELDKFLASIGHLPLAITLTAACGGRLKASPADLLRDWRIAGIGIMSGHETLSMDETIRVSIERGVVRSNPEALTLLAILSMLPAGTTGNNLRWWAPSFTSPSPALQTLRTAALIEQDEGAFSTARIFIRPTIQSYMSQQNRISTEIRDLVYDACFKFVLDHKSIPDDRKFKDDLEALATEETNIQRLLMDVDVHNLQSNAIDALIAFGFYQSWTRPSTHLASRALKALLTFRRNSSDLSDPRAAARRVAEAHRCLGRNLFALDRYGKAYKYFEEASRLFQSLPDLALAGECAMDSLRMWRFMKRAGNDELESRVQEAQANLSHDRNDRYHVARGLLGFGEFLWWRKRRTEAIQPLYEASKIFEDLNCSASAAQSLHYLARTYARLEELSKALLVSRDALAKAEECGETGLLCSALKITAIYLMASEAYDDALPSITQALAASRSVGYPNGIAQSLELMAYNCAARMDLSGARIAYEGARAHFAKRGSARIGSRGVARCAENVEKLRQLPELNQDSFANLTKPVPWY